MAWAEHEELPRKFYDFFTLYDPNHKVGFAPAGFVEFGFTPSIGFIAFANDAFVPHNDVRLHVEAWPDAVPTQWLGLSFTDSMAIGDGRKLTFHTSATKRPDMMFFGEGPRTVEANKSRYAIDRFDASGTFDSSTWRSSTIAVSLGVRKTSTHDGHLWGDPSLSQGAQAGAFAIPAGFGSTYTAPYERIDAVLDTRPPGKNGTGLRVEGHAEQLTDVEHGGSWRALRYGGSVAALLDVNGHGRVLGLTVATLFADPLTHVPVPFTELPTLGGTNLMPAYFAGRLVDRSALVATLRYDWPIAPLIAGTLQTSAGNVFGAHLDGAAPGLTRLSFALGLSTSAFGTPAPEILVGAGTDTFDQGLQLNTVRIAVGVPRSF